VPLDGREHRSGGGAEPAVGGDGDGGLEFRCVVSNRHEGDVAARLYQRWGEEADGESGADELHHGRGVVHLVGDRASHAGGGERAVDGHPDAPALREVDQSFVAEGRELDVAALSQGMSGRHGEHDRLASEGDELETRRCVAGRARHTVAGFWALALAFTTAMAFTTVPTPLWSLYAERDRFSSLTVTIVFAVYALAVALSLFLAGHLSDAYGRRRVLMPAVAVEIVAAVVFVVWPSLPGLLFARVLTGLGVGAVTATATAWLGELRAGRHAQVVATGANLGGLGLGGLVSGLLAQFAAGALVVPFVVFIVALVMAVVALLAAPETRHPRLPRPRYHPQRVSVPEGARGRFLAAALGAAITFSVFGLLTSLAPSFLAGTLHQPSHALAGAVSFAVFATAALAQTLTASRPPAAAGGGGDPGLAGGTRPAHGCRVAACPQLWRLRGW
jgi:MFS family permease